MKNIVADFTRFIYQIVYYILNLTMKGYNMNNELPKDFIISDEYCVIEPGLTKFNKDQIITHTELLEHLEENDINTIRVLPHLSTQ